MYFMYESKQNLNPPVFRNLFPPRTNIKYVLRNENSIEDPPGMRHCSDVSVRSHIVRGVADHAETSSQRHNRYVNETNLCETSLRRLIGTWNKLTYLRRHNDIAIDS